MTTNKVMELEDAKCWLNMLLMTKQLKHKSKDLRCCYLKQGQRVNRVCLLTAKRKKNELECWRNRALYIVAWKRYCRLWDILIAYSQKLHSSCLNSVMHDLYVTPWSFALLKLWNTKHNFLQCMNLYSISILLALQLLY